MAENLKPLDFGRIEKATDGILKSENLIGVVLAYHIEGMPVRDVMELKEKIGNRIGRKRHISNIEMLHEGNGVTVFVEVRFYA